MTKRTIKKSLFYGLSVLVILVATLFVHIYLVTRPRITAETRTMARIDIRQQINQQDASKITSWLYQQNGVDHVLVNPQSGIAVFTFAPAKASANDIVDRFRSTMPYKADRFVPSESDLKGSCPVASGSLTYKAYRFVKNIF